MPEFRGRRGREDRGRAGPGRRPQIPTGPHCPWYRSSPRARADGGCGPMCRHPGGCSPPASFAKTAKAAAVSRWKREFRSGIAIVSRIRTSPVKRQHAGSSCPPEPWTQQWTISMENTNRRAGLSKGTGQGRYELPCGGRVLRCARETTGINDSLTQRCRVRSVRKVFFRDRKGLGEKIATTRQRIAAQRAAEVFLRPAPGVPAERHDEWITFPRCNCSEESMAAVGTTTGRRLCRLPAGTGRIVQGASETWAFSNAAGR